MGRIWQNVVLLLGLCTVAQTLVSNPVEAVLDPTFYDQRCPEVFPIVADGVLRAFVNEPRIAGSLLRLHFHDCFVQGCDASNLLDGDESEKSALPNLNSVRGYEVIDKIKVAAEQACPQVVSCADIEALAALFSVVLTGGPIWTLPLGRYDSFEPNKAAANLSLPGPFFDIALLRASFQAQSLDDTDLVALSGGHTIGKARCAAFFDRLYNFSNINPSGKPDPLLDTSLRRQLRLLCGPPQANGGAADGNITTGMDLNTQNTFDNSYFKQLLENDGLFHSDQVLFSSDNATRALVQKYALSQASFFRDFANSMVRMGNLNPKSASDGEVRRNCTVRNPHIRNPGTVQLPGKISMRKFAPKTVEIDARAEQLFKDKVVDAIEMAVNDYLDGQAGDADWTVEDVNDATIVAHSSI